MIAGVLEELGVRISHVGDKEITGYCPVHHLTEGVEQSSPKWYMNAETGAWICFTCGQRGSLPSLVLSLGGDPETIEQLKLSAALTTTSRWVQDGQGVEVEERVLVDPAVFDAHPWPPVRKMDAKDIDITSVRQYNVRWDARGACWMLPVYTFDGLLAGWQEKSDGYFMNVPKKVKKSESLFGWHTFNGGQLVVVESPLDAVRFHTYGFKAVAIYGSFVSAEQLAHIALADRIVLAFDNDDAGDHALEQSTKALMKGHPNVRVFKYPSRSRGKDPGDLTVQQLIEGVTLAQLPTNKENKNAQQHENRHQSAHGGQQVAQGGKRVARPAARRGAPGSRLHDRSAQVGVGGTSRRRKATPY